MLHLQRGTPYIYQGEELGMTNGAFTAVDEFRDIESLNFYARSAGTDLVAEQVLNGLRRNGRDNARTPVQWDASPGAGFTTGTPWIGVNPNHSWLNAAVQYDDPASVFTYYQQLIAIRHQRDVVALGSFTRIDLGEPAVFAFERTLGRDRLLVVTNLSDSDLPTLASPAQWHNATLILGNYTDASPHTGLRPWEARVFAARRN